MAGSPAPQFTSARQEHVNVPLSNFALGYHPTGFIAEQVFPVNPVKNESDLYYKYDKGQAFRVGRSDGRASIRPDGTRAKQLNFGATLDSYQAEESAYETYVTDRELANADSALNIEQSRIRRVQDLVLVDYELRVSNIVSNSANYPSANVTTNSGTSQWNNTGFTSSPAYQHSAIKAQFDAGIEAVRKSTGGLLPNYVILPRPIEVVMFNDPGLVDLVKYNYSNPTNLISGNYLGDTLWGMKILRPLSLYTVAAEGEAVTLLDIWGKNVIMFYRDANLGLDMLTLGLTLRQRPWQVKSFRDEYEDKTVHRAGFIQAEKFVTGDCGYLIQSAVA